MYVYTYACVCVCLDQVEFLDDVGCERGSKRLECVVPSHPLPQPQNIVKY